MAVGAPDPATQQDVVNLLRRALPELVISPFDEAAALVQGLRQDDFDCVLLSDHLPIFNSVNLLRQIRLTPNCKHLPIVILADNDESLAAVKAIKLGATDYLPKQKMSVVSLRQAVLASINAGEQAQQQEDRTRQLQAQALSDPLTGLGNRRAFQQQLDELTHPQRRRPRRFALVLIDLNQFKQVNDRFGHHAGDTVLIEVAHGLQHTTRANDGVFRLGGDEFAVLIDNYPAAIDAQRMAERLHAQLARPIGHADQICYPGGASLGVALYPDHGSLAGELTAAADRAMYRSKSRGGGVSLAASEDAGAAGDGGTD